MAPLYAAAAKKNAAAEGAAILYEDEATFRKDPTLYQTWAPIGFQPQVPTTGSREACKVFGAVNPYTARFHYRMDCAVFNAQTYVLFLEQLAREYYPQKIHVISDNASYHKKEEVWDFVREQHGRIALHFLPPYSPELNPVERTWHHVRMQATHNRYFVTLEELAATLKRVFRNIQIWPEQIAGYMAPFINN